MLFYYSYLLHKFILRKKTSRDHRSSGVCIRAQNKQVQYMAIKNNVSEVLYLLHAFCFYVCISIVIIIVLV